jgi:hypothetical protein
MNKRVKKLALSKETLRSLVGHELRRIEGAGTSEIAPTACLTCHESCGASCFTPRSEC